MKPLSHAARWLTVASLLVTLITQATPGFADGLETDEAVPMLANQPETEAEFTEAHNAGCMGHVQIDTAAGTTFRTFEPITGWTVDLLETFARGTELVEAWLGAPGTGTFLASDGLGRTRLDVDAHLGRPDLRAGYELWIDWSAVPAGMQNITVRTKTHCDWVSGNILVNVQPTPPAPPTSLSINDERRTVGTGFGGTGCTAVDIFGNCTSFTGTGTSQNCIRVDISGNCTAYSNIISSSASDTTFSFQVRLSAASSQTVTVNYATADGTAVSGTDYTSTSGVLTFNPGETSKDVNVRVYGTTSSSTVTRVFYVRLTNPTNASISDSEGTGTIDYRGTTTGTGICPSGYFWNGSQCVLSGTTTGNTVTAVSTSSGTIFVTWGSTGGQSIRVYYQQGACTGLWQGPQTFSSNTTSGTVVGLVPNTTYCLQARRLEFSGTETILSISATGGTTGGGGGVVTPTLSITDTSCAEGNAGTTSCLFSVLLSPSSTSQVTVFYRTTSAGMGAGFALGGTSCLNVGTDYLNVTSIQLTFNPGETFKQASVSICGDSLVGEGSEILFVELFSATVATIGDFQAIGTILSEE